VAKTNKNRQKSTSKSRAESRTEIDLVGGSYDKKKFGVVFPTPKYIVLNMGTELYERQDPDIVMDATYRYTDNWDTYKEWLKEQGLIK
jgi:hypothetical protein